MNPTTIRKALYGKMAGDTTLNGASTVNDHGLLAPPPAVLHPTDLKLAGYNKSIFFNFAPDEAEYPFVVFNKQAGTPTYANASKPVGGALRAAYETDVWQIKAIDQQTTAGRAEAVSARLQDLLNDAGLSISGATTMWLRRDSDVPTYVEITDGRPYVHCGSLYRLIFEPT